MREPHRGRVRVCVDYWSSETPGKTFQSMPCEMPLKSPLPGPLSLTHQHPVSSPPLLVQPTDLQQQPLLYYHLDLDRRGDPSEAAQNSRSSTSAPCRACRGIPSSCRRGALSMSSRTPFRLPGTCRTCPCSPVEGEGTAPSEVAARFPLSHRALVAACALPHSCLIGYVGGLVVAVVVETLRSCASASGRKHVRSSMGSVFPASKAQTAPAHAGQTHGKCLVKTSQLLIADMKRASQCQPLLAHTVSHDSPCAPFTASTSAGIFAVLIGTGDRQCFLSVIYALPCTVLMLEVRQLALLTTGRMRVSGNT